MIAQLRTYTINKGMVDAWLELFEEKIVPLLKDHGVGIHSAWLNEDRTKFIWIRTFEDQADLERKEAAVYGSEWWKKNVDHVRSHFAHRDIKVITPFLPDGA